MRAGHRRSAHQERDGAPDVAGLPEEQVRGLLRQGRQRSRARHDRRRRSGDGVPDLDLAGLHDGLAEVDVDGQQQDARRRRVFIQQGRLQHRQPTGDYPAAGYGCVVCGCQPARPRSEHALHRARQRTGPVSRSVQLAGGGVVCDRIAQRQDGRAVELGALPPDADRERRPGSAVPERRTRRGRDLEYAARLDGSLERGSRRFCPGRVDAETPDGQLWRAVGVLQLRSLGVVSRSRPVRAGTELRPDSDAGVEGHRSTVRRGL